MNAIIIVSVKRHPERETMFHAIYRGGFSKAVQDGLHGAILPPQCKTAPDRLPSMH